MIVILTLTDEVCESELDLPDPLRPPRDDDEAPRRGVKNDNKL